MMWIQVLKVLYYVQKGTVYFRKDDLKVCESEWKFSGVRF